MLRRVAVMLRNSLRTTYTRYMHVRNIPTTSPSCRRRVSVCVCRVCAFDFACGRFVLCGAVKQRDRETDNGIEFGIR